MTESALVSEIGMRILRERYFLRDDEGNLLEEALEQMYARVAEAVASVETDPVKRAIVRDSFYELMVEGRFLPNTPTLMNAGSDHRVLSGCFFLPIGDSRESIMNTMDLMVKVQAFGGGTGFNFSSLRERGSFVSSTKGKASGPISFMKAYDAVTNTIKQGGKRRGANIALLKVDHPDIEEFIFCKDEDGVLSNFNISVAVTEDFLRAVREKRIEFPLVSPKDGKVVRVIDPCQLWSKIIEGAWRMGEPGVFFWDRVQEQHTLTMPIGGVNPCWSGDTKVWTVNGPKDFSDLAASGKDVEVYCYRDGQVAVGVMHNPLQTHPEAEVIELVVKAPGYDMFRHVLTPNHKLFRYNKGEVEEVSAKRLKPGNILVGCDESEVTQDTLVLAVNKLDDKEPVYNGIVDGVHNYFVFMKGGEGKRGILSKNCGELPLCDYESCNLGSLNLSAYVVDGAWDLVSLHTDTKTAVRFLDNVISLSEFADERIAEMTRANRKIGLGIMGLADALVMMKTKYSSEEGRDLASKAMTEIQIAAWHASAELGQEKGVFPNYEKYAKPGLIPARNAAVTCIAPTGTLAILAGCYHGIEPMWDWSGYKMNRLDATMEEKAHPLAKPFLRSGLALPDYFESVDDVSPKDQVLMQAALQVLVDSSISKTINFKKNTPREEIEEAIWLAYDSGCKGITVYRDGCRDNQTLMSKAQSAGSVVANVVPSDFIIGSDSGTEIPGNGVPHAAQRPPVLDARIHQVNVLRDKLYVTVAWENNSKHKKVRELWITPGKRTNSNIKALCETVGRLASTTLQYGVPLEEVIKSFNNLVTDHIFYYQQKTMRSISEVVGEILTEYLEKEDNELGKVCVGEICLFCGGSNVVKTDGCKMCMDCKESVCM